MKVLSLSDTELPFIYSPQVRNRFKGTDLILGCGDLPYYYLEYVYDALGSPLFFVRGNHDKEIEYTIEGQRTYPHGGVDLHRRTAIAKGLILAGIEGSVKYRNGPYQYTQSEMWFHVLRLVPAFLYYRLRFGRFVDLMITHAPPAGIHDRDDLPHHGIRAFRWLIDVFHPAYFIHGHIHVHRPDIDTETIIGSTRVINTYGYREIMVELRKD
ncbi:MAG: hypothetical protein B6D39_02525 [Anaerolineae bacterium UTCFX2]|jgi:Icc-related predicted phosphoesterase|nr:metallophosphoesterase family protein [Anaerolineae bacterium]MCZ7552835.1 metallophosphoesterase [Anaerolineales bacterium]OQY93754.1 MAG: hypothetical protein B6D39_02525 [Anaerolineae bacterium UTCFX2]